MNTETKYLNKRKTYFRATNARAATIDMLNRGKSLVDIALTLRIPMSTLNNFVNNKTEFEYWKNKTYQKNSIKSKNMV